MLKFLERLYFGIYYFDYKVDFLLLKVVWAIMWLPLVCIPYLFPSFMRKLRSMGKTPRQYVYEGKIKMQKMEVKNMEWKSARGLTTFLVLLFIHIYGDIAFVIRAIFIDYELLNVMVVGYSVLFLACISTKAMLYFMEKRKVIKRYKRKSKKVQQHALYLFLVTFISSVILFLYFFW